MNQLVALGETERLLKLPRTELVGDRFLWRRERPQYFADISDPECNVTISTMHVQCVKKCFGRLVRTSV